MLRSMVARVGVPSLLPETSSSSSSSSSSSEADTSSMVLLASVMGRFSGFCRFVRGPDGMPPVPFFDCAASES